MVYYKLEVVEGYDWIWSNDIELRGYTLEFDGKPMIDKWKEFEVDYVDKGKRDFDICLATSPLFIFSKRALDFLKDILIKYGELLPLKSPNSNYMAYHCTNIIEEALNIEKSEIDWLDEEEGWINGINKFIFKREQIKGEIIFRIPSKYSDVTFFGDPFKKIVEQNNLKAFHFSTISNR